MAPAVHGYGRRPARARGVGGGRDDRPPGAPRQLAPARGLLPAARGRPGQGRAGERVLHPTGVTGVRRPSRHARRPRRAGRGREAVEALRPASRAAAQAPALLGRARRARGADRRPGAPRGGHALPSPWLAARGGDVHDRLAAPHDRDRGPHLGRRGAGRARARARTNHCSAATSRAATARASRRASPKSSGPTWSSIGGGGGSSTRVARSGRTASRSSARSSGSMSTRFSSDARP